MSGKKMKTPVVMFNCSKYGAIYHTSFRLSPVEFGFVLREMKDVDLDILKGYPVMKVIDATEDLPMLITKVEEYSLFVTTYDDPSEYERITSVLLQVFEKAMPRRMRKEVNEGIRPLYSYIFK
jgi:hypothetical protein